MKKYLLYLKSEPFSNILTIHGKRNVITKSKVFQTINFEPRKHSKPILFPFNLSKFIYLLFLLPTIVNAQPKFIPQYPYFKTSQNSFSSLWVNGTQFSNYITLSKHKPNQSFDSGDTTSIDIAEIAKRSDIIVVNEINSPFEMRAFVINAMPVLAKNNFTHIIMDIENDTSYFPITRKFPILPLSDRMLEQYESLIKEPLYASIIRTAKLNKIKITGIDSFEKNTNRTSAILNQIKKVRTNTTAGKLLIYLSVGDVSSNDIMNALNNPSLKGLKLSSINALNSWKITHVEKLDPYILLRKTLYTQLKDSLNSNLIRRYNLVVKENIFYGTRPLIISKFIGRYFQNANRPKDQLHSCPCIVAAYRLEDLAYKDRAIPYDLTQVEKISEIALLTLDPGMYFIYASNSNNELIMNFFDFVK
ncbi:MAG: hypothetical protein M9931_00685 [Chitinophagales bacterium]|nr:hypothetical protein [Chitinophagales bacterium]